MSEDCAGDGHNWYVYGINNPILYNDLSGSSAALVLIALFALVTHVAIESWEPDSPQMKVVKHLITSALYGLDCVLVALEALKGYPKTGALYGSAAFQLMAASLLAGYILGVAAYQINLLLILDGIVDGDMKHIDGTTDYERALHGSDSWGIDWNQIAVGH